MLAEKYSTLHRPGSSTRLSYELDTLTMHEWQAYVESHPDSNIFHHRSWIEALQHQYKLDAFIPCLRDGEDVTAAVPFLVSRTAFGGKKFKSLPFTDCLRILGRGRDSGDALLSKIAAQPPQCVMLALRTDTLPSNLKASSNAVRHDLNIATSQAAMLDSFKPSVQRNLAKAKRAGLRFERHTDDDAMEQFYRLHLFTRRKLGIPIQPKQLFAMLQSKLIACGLGYIGLVYKDNIAVAGGVFLAFNQTLTYKYAASHPGYLADRPNDWLVYNALRRGQEDGYRKFDFGISARQQEGLRRFKRNWGATESEVYDIQLVGRQKTPLEETMAFRATGVVIRHAPPIVCRAIGEMLYRFAT